jgi:hypothetical protein
LKGDVTFNYGNNGTNGVVAGNAIFNAGMFSNYNHGSIFGDTLFHGGSYNASDGYTYGTTTFLADSFMTPAYNAGTVFGKAVFNSGDYGSSYNSGTTSALAIFNGSTYNQGSLLGPTILNNTSYIKSGTVASTTTLNDTSYVKGGIFSSTTIELYDQSYLTDTSSPNISSIENIIFNGDDSYSTFDITALPRAVRYSALAPQTNLTRNFASSGPLTVIADGVAVDMRTTIYEPNIVSLFYTNLVTLNGGSFIFTTPITGGHRPYRPPVIPDTTITPQATTTLPTQATTTQATTTPEVIATTTPPVISPDEPEVEPKDEPKDEPQDKPIIKDKPEIIPDQTETKPDNPKPHRDNHNEENTQPKVEPGNGGSGEVEPIIIPPIVISVPTLISSIKEDFTSSYDFAKKTTEVTTKKVKEIVESPAGSISTKVVSTAGVAASGAVAMTSLFLNPASISEVFLLPLRLWGLFLSVLGIRRRARPWGTVYDSITKQPLDPAYVVLQDMSGKEISTSITDLDGRYGFSTLPGQYKITANKTNYTFPSQRLAGQLADELYSDLYFGAPINVTEEGSILAKNIPLDPEHFDWNEVAKRNMGVMRFYSKYDLLIKKVSNVFFTVGFIISIIALLVAPYPYNTIIFLLYLAMTILRIFGVKPKYYGWVLDKTTGTPLAFSIIHFYSQDLERELTKKVCDSSGRYYALVPPGKYTLTIDRKNADGTYTSVFTSGVIEAKKGVVNEVVRV